jgi:exopolysaccharide production protein ExoZ
MVGALREERNVDQRLRSLQALRGIACLAVIAFHLPGFEDLTWPHRHLMTWARPFGWAGVDLFFVLSGFIITWTQFKHIGQRAAVGSYLARRLWRIYPLYWVILSGAVLTSYLLFGYSLALHGGVAALAHQVFLWPWDLGMIHVPVAWSLTFEVMFYLLFTVFIVAPRRWFVPLLFTWTALVLAKPIVLPDVGAYWLPFTSLTFEFLVGCWTALACRSFTRGAGRSVVAGGLGIVIGLVILNLGLGGDSPWRGIVLGPPAGLIVYALTTWDRAGAIRPPGWLCRIGDASYSIYLTHWTVATLVLFLTQRWPHTLLGHIAWLALVVGATLGFGYLCYLGVERPLLRLAQRRPSAAKVETQPPIARAA